MKTICKTGLSLAFLLLSIQTVFSQYTISGVIRDKNGAPINSAKIRIFDYDTFSSNDHMGTVYSNPGGYYELKYSQKNWDTGSGSSKYPDVFAIAEISVDGQCDGFDFDASVKWKEIARTRTFNNNDPSTPLIIQDIKAITYPFESAKTVVTFKQCEDMYCWFSWYFKMSCYACYEGKKYEWTDWWESKIPYQVSKCISVGRGNGDCNAITFEEIKNKCNDVILESGTSDNDLGTIESSLSTLQTKCKGVNCNDLLFGKDTTTDQITVKNKDTSLLALDFYSKMGNRKRKVTFKKMVASDQTVAIPALKYVEVVVKVQKKDRGSLPTTFNSN
jgi:hypothetical protein